MWIISTWILVLTYFCILIADIEPGASGVKATLLGIWKNIGQIRIIRAKKNVYSIRVGSQKLEC